MSGCAQSELTPSSLCSDFTPRENLGAIWDSGNQTQQVPHTPLASIGDFVSAGPSPPQKHPPLTLLPKHGPIPLPLGGFDQKVYMKGAESVSPIQIRGIQRPKGSNLTQMLSATPTRLNSLLVWNPLGLSNLLAHLITVSFFPLWKHTAGGQIQREICTQLLQTSWVWQNLESPSHTSSFLGTVRPCLARRDRKLLSVRS